MKKQLKTLEPKNNERMSFSDEKTFKTGEEVFCTSAESKNPDTSE